MKFISEIEKNDKPFAFEAQLDASLLRELPRVGGVFSADYDIAVTAPSLPYLQGTAMSLYFELTENDIYTSAILFVGYDNINKKLRPYETDGMIPFNVSLTEDEKRRVLVTLIKKNFIK